MPALVNAKIDEHYNQVVLRADKSLEIIPLREAFERYDEETRPDRRTNGATAHRRPEHLLLASRSRDVVDPPESSCGASSRYLPSVSSANPWLGHVEVADPARRVLAALETSSAAKNREVEAAKARERSQARFA
jgi:hypothetical protein